MKNINNYKYTIEELKKACGLEGLNAEFTVLNPKEFIECQILEFNAFGENPIDWLNGFGCTTWAELLKLFTTNECLIDNDQYKNGIIDDIPFVLGFAL